MGGGDGEGGGQWDGVFGGRLAAIVFGFWKHLKQAAVHFLFCLNFDSLFQDAPMRVTTFKLT